MYLQISENKQKAGLSALFILISLLLMAASAGAVSYKPVDDFGSNPGELNFYIYQPKDQTAANSAVVVLHGCSQSAQSFAESSGWVQMADEKNVLLILPEQKTYNNTLRCFNWFQPSDTARGQGEVVSIAQMVQYAKKNYMVDSSRVFVTGLSAGGAMAGAMLATYPELFTAGAIVGGVPFGCAANLGEAYNCMAGLRSRSAQSWGEEIRKAADFKGPWPRLSIWHAERDSVLNSKNAIEQIKQWTNVHDLSYDEPEYQSNGSHQHYEFKNTEGETMVEAWLLQSSQHGWPVNPPAAFSWGRTGASKICGHSDSYVIDMDLCAAYEISQFWGL